MIVERTRPTASQVEVLDRVLDKGIVIDAWIRVALMGIDLITVQARVVVASIHTYLESSEALAVANVASPITATTMTSLEQPPTMHPRRLFRARSRMRIPRD